MGGVIHGHPQAVGAEIPGVGAGPVARMNSQLGNRIPGPETLGGTGWLQLPPLLVGRSCSSTPAPHLGTNCSRGSAWWRMVLAPSTPACPLTVTSSQREKEILMEDFQVPVFRGAPHLPDLGCPTGFPFLVEG